MISVRVPRVVVCRGKMLPKKGQTVSNISWETRQKKINKSLNSKLGLKLRYWIPIFWRSPTSVRVRQKRYQNCALYESAMIGSVVVKFAEWVPKFPSLISDWLGSITCGFWYRYSQHGVTKSEQFLQISRIRLGNISFWKITSAFIDEDYQCIRGVCAFFTVIPLKIIYYPDFIQTWHNWQLYIEHWKTAMKSWVHHAFFRPACSARNSKRFSPSCARLNVRNFNNRRKFVITWQKLWIIMKSWVRLFVWAIIFE